MLHLDDIPFRSPFPSTLIHPPSRPSNTPQKFTTTSIVKHARRWLCSFSQTGSVLLRRQQLINYHIYVYIFLFLAFQQLSPPHHLLSRSQTTTMSPKIAFAHTNHFLKLKMVLRYLFYNIPTEQELREISSYLKCEFKRQGCV